MPTPPQRPCIFCKIIEGVAPCYKIYEDDHVIAFLDVQPLCPGHSLLVPKTCVRRVDLMSPESIARTAAALPHVSKMVMHIAEADDFNIIQNNGRLALQVVRDVFQPWLPREVSNGREVDHVHFHLIPRAKGQGLQVRPRASLSPNEAKKLLERAKTFDPAASSRGSKAPEPISSLTPSRL